MQLNVKTILNLKEKNPHFVYRDVRLTETKGQRIEVKVEPRRGSKGICSGCGKKCAGYDRLPQREFIHVPLWGIAVIFLYCYAPSGLPHLWDNGRGCSLEYRQEPAYDQLRLVFKRMG